MPHKVHFAHTELRDAAAAVADFAAQLGTSSPDAILFFCASSYDLTALGDALARTFTAPVVGCTSSGQIGPGGFHRCGLTGVAFSGGALRMRPFLVRPLSEHAVQAALIANALRAPVGRGTLGHRFGLLLVDGLSMLEERLTASLYQSIGNIPIIGGSAGDNLHFERTFVYAGDGRFLDDAAVFAVIDSETEIHTFKVQHFLPSERQLVITEADPERRIIFEMDGEPAAIAYAEAIGVKVDALSSTVFSRHPLVLTRGGEQYLRSIQKLNQDLSLTCYCAIEQGLIVSIGRGVDPLTCLQSAFDDIRARIASPLVVIGCDCILRRLEYEGVGTDTAVGELLAHNNVVGFSTYGEQFNGVHVNQTLTGVAIGA